MSTLSDIWHGIRSSFDINKMKRDPVGSIAKIGLVYGLGSTAIGAIAPDFAKRAGEWLESGFGFYGDPALQRPLPKSGKGAYDYSKAKGMSRIKYESLSEAERAKIWGGGRGFLERTVTGAGKFLARPFNIGMDINKWTKGDISWNDIKSKHFNWVNTENISEMAQLTNALRGGGGGPGGRGKGERRGVSHRDFKSQPAGGVNISAAREGGMYKQGGISQALITGSISPETLAMLGYGSGQVTGAQERSIDLEDVGKIKTTLTSAVG